MIALPVLFGALPPLLALISLLALAWVRRRDRLLQTDAQRQCRKLAADLDTLYTRGEAIRQRALLVARVYDHATPEEQADLTLGCYRDLERVEALRARLATASKWVERLHGRPLRDRLLAIRAVMAEMDRLTHDLADSNAFWASQLSGGPGVQPAARRTA